MFVRLAHPEARLEAITSHPLLLSGIAEKTRPRQSRVGEALLTQGSAHAPGLEKSGGAVEPQDRLGGSLQKPDYFLNRVQQARTQLGNPLHQRVKPRQLRR
ncbi:MAG TPA: hypothetical protein VES89_04760 [Candidatus Competibacteraceae bacterium]|nr:hypothetical protein [Candidatus Competibacteraceae bacterium]